MSQGYLEQRLEQLGIQPEQNSIRVQITDIEGINTAKVDIPIFESDEHGNILINYWTYTVTEFSTSTSTPTHSITTTISSSTTNANACETRRPTQNTYRQKDSRRIRFFRHSWYKSTPTAPKYARWLLPKVSLRHSRGHSAVSTW